MIGGILPVVLMIAIFYFLVFMPMRRQQRNQKEMLKTLQNGQTVLTSGGIIGTIVTVNDDSLILRIKPDNLKIQVARSAVTSVVSTAEPAKK
jgi:preprotein translocase subunit YajC